MANNARNWKELWLKGMEAIGSAASNVANCTQQKVNEMNLTNRRREILADFGEMAYAEWQKGATFPPKMQDLLEELNDLEEQLNVIAAEKEARAAQKRKDVEVDAQSDAPVIDVEEEQPAGDAPVQVGLLDRLFDKAGETAEKLANAIPAEKIEEKTQNALNYVEKAFDKMTDAVESSIESLKRPAENEDGMADVEDVQNKEVPTIEVHIDEEGNG